MCEVDKEMECGWERIYRKLEKLNKLDNMKYDTPKVRNYCNPNAEEPII
jgi:electron transport complex protein RnfC